MLYSFRDIFSFSKKFAILIRWWPRFACILVARSLLHLWDIEDPLEWTNAEDASSIVFVPSSIMTDSPGHRVLPGSVPSMFVQYVSCLEGRD